MNWAEILQLAIEHARQTGERPYVFGAPDRGGPSTRWRYYFCRHYGHPRERPCSYRTVVRWQPAGER